MSLTEVLPLLLIVLAFINSRSILEPAGVGSVRHGGSFWQFFTEATPVAPRYQNLVTRIQYTAPQLGCTLKYDKLAGWTSSARMKQLRVKLPQFRMEERYVLNKTLQEMRVMSVFDWGKADLLGISGKDGLIVSKAIQKSFVEVNEEGTEAVGAMGLVASPLCHPISYEFKADHSFLFIKHNLTKIILFCGRYSSS